MSAPALRHPVPYRQMNPARKLLTVETGRALYSHIQGLRGDPRLSSAEERFLATLARQLYDRWYTAQFSEKQMTWLWDISDRLEQPDQVPPPSPPVAPRS